MATVSDPNFGADFDADEFRTQIRNTMFMGMPNAVEDRVTFRWSVRRAYSIEDNQGNPYNFSATPTNVVENPDVQVPVAVEFVSRQGNSEFAPIGDIRNPRATLTILDVDYVEIEGADQVLIGNQLYTIDFVGPPIGLFSVTIYQLYCTAVDQK